MNKLANAVLDFFVPQSCPCCTRLIGTDRLICEDCEKKLKLYDSIEAPPELCSLFVSAFIYEDEAKNGVLALKEGEGRNFAVYAAGLIAPKLEGCGATLITSVPMSLPKQLYRGGNQSDVFAKELGKRLGLPCDLKLLRQRNDRDAQHDLPAAERREHAENIYEVAQNARSLKGEKIILCDDIRTTGSTLTACASLLLSLGAEEVAAVTICRATKK